MKKSFYIFALFLIMSGKLYSWGDLGHSTIGLLAESRLNSKAKGFLNEFMGSEPLAISAIWPDLVRADERFADFAPLHYLEVPYNFKFKDLNSQQRAPLDAALIIDEVPKLLLDKNLTPNDKALLFRYFVHVVGDLHQPLHVGNGVDRGANLCDVKFKGSRSNEYKEMNLHSLWDNALVDEIKELVIEEAKKDKKLLGYFQYPYFGAYLERKFSKLISNEDMNHLAANEASIWFDEAQALHSKVYPDATMVSDPKLRPYCKFVDPQTRKVSELYYKKSKIPRLDKTYAKKVLPIIEERIFLAGLRLSFLINKIAEKSTSKVLETEKEQEKIHKILDKLKQKS